MYIILSWGSTEVLLAQWTAADSLRLHRLLSGQDTLRLRPEVEKSIREGSLLNLDKKKSSLLEVSPEKFSVEIDVSQWGIRPEQSPWKTKEEIESLPPQVFWLYTPELSDRDEWGRKKKEVNPRVNAYLASLRIYRKPALQSLDFNHALSSVFSSHYRQLQKNKKTAQAYQTYSLPSPETLAKRREYLKQHPEAALPVRKEKAQDAIALKKDSVRAEPVDSMLLDIGLPSAYNE